MSEDPQNKKQKGFRHLHGAFWATVSKDRIIVTDCTSAVEGALAVGCLIFVLGYVLVGVNSIVNMALVISATSVTENIPEVRPVEVPTEIVPTATGGAEYFVFTDKWTPGDMDAFTLQGEEMKLNDGYTRALFTYAQEVPQLQKFNFKFAPSGVHGVNLSFGRAEFYEIVIGDNDHKTFSLKVIQKIGGDWEDVPESTWEALRPQNNPLRPYLVNCVMENGEEIEVEVNEELLSQKKQFRLEVSVTCNNSNDSDSFTYIFYPTPNWEKRNQVYFGLVDYSSNSINKTSIYFTEPDLVSYLNTELSSE